MAAKTTMAGGSEIGNMGFICVMWGYSWDDEGSGCYFKVEEIGILASCWILLMWYWTYLI